MDPIIFDTSDGQELRINMISPFLKKQFGRKIVKLSLDGGFTCPNRDGSKGTGGCLFCSESGSGDMASCTIDTAGSTVDTPGSTVGTAGSTVDTEDSTVGTPGSTSPGSADWSVRVSDITSALDRQIRLLSDKWPDAGYIAYFQSHTNTYADVNYLRQLFYGALEHPEVVGIAIATRSDCISDDVLELLHELNQKTFLWVDLGLQTIHDETAKAMNLCHTLADYDDAVARLTECGIRVVTHLILGLPGEDRQMMLDSVRYVCSHTNNGISGNLCLDEAVPNKSDSSSTQHIFGIKLHMLNVVKGSGMEVAYPGYIPFETMDDYIDILIDCIENIPPDITVHRISGDAPRSILIAPEWSYRKRTILNEIHRQMRLRNTWQGKAL